MIDVQGKLYTSVEALYGALRGEKDAHRVIALERAIKVLQDRRMAEFDSLSWKGQVRMSRKYKPPTCGCHCYGGCGDPYAACQYPCAKHVPF